MTLTGTSARCPGAASGWPPTQRPSASSRTRRDSAPSARATPHRPPRTPCQPCTPAHNSLAHPTRPSHSLAPTLGRWGPRTTELRHSACYNFSNRAQCNWNGGVWPYETCKAGTALVNLLQLYPAQACAVHAAVCMPQCACICMHSTTLRSARRRALPSSAFSSRTRAHTRAPMRRASRPRTSMRTCTPVRNCTPPAPRLHPPAPRWVPPLPIPLHPTPSLPPFPTSRNAHACRRRLLDHPAQAARHRAVAGHRRAGRGARPAARARHPLLPLDI